MLFRLTSAPRSLVNRIRSTNNHPYVSSRVGRDSPLTDATKLGSTEELKRFGTTLEVEWIAREVHPWDRNRTPTSVQRLYTLPCLEDAHTAIERLFDEIPDGETLQDRFSARP